LWETTGTRQFSSMPDEEIVVLAQKGDKAASDFITEKYYPLVRNKARGYFLVGADNDDIQQEGLIGLYEAVRDYNSEKQASFRTFAEMCIKRQIMTAIKTATRQKHIPLNTYVSLSKPSGSDEGDKPLIEMIPFSLNDNPEDMFISLENITEMNSEIGSSLSEFELKVLNQYLSGVSYLGIALSLGKEEKAIDNAIQRIRRKLSRSRAR